MYRIFQQIIYGGQRFLLWVLLLCFGAFFISSQIQAQETSVCAEVKIVIEQKLSFERQAFDAKMVISNGLHDADVKDVSIELLFMDQNEQPVVATTDPNADPNMTGAKFFYRTDTLKGIDSIEGEGQVAADSAAEIHWLIIPSFGASSDEGTLYYVGAKVTYTLNEVTTTVDVTPDYIVVKPQPMLTLDYFLPTDVYADDPFTEEVEPPVPFTLGVRITNTGGGAALKTSIESAQPRIVENKQNLLIDFKILGGYVSDEPAGQSLLLDFGDIAARSAKVGRWNMITTLSGKFVEFNANYSHADELGGLVTSLLQEVRTHTLVHDVKVDLPGRDNIRDFLALDVDVLRVYESDGIDTVVTDQSKTAQLTLQGDSATISYQATPGFSYIKIDDPYQESRVPVSVVRSDGKVLPPENIWLSKTRNEDLSWSYFINLFDVDSTGNYDITFSPNTLASISGMVFEDTNGNGVLDEGERGVGVAKITLTGVTQEGNSVVTTAYTDVRGYFGFNQVQPGHYTLEVADAQGMIDIASIAGSNGGVAELGRISSIDLNAGMQAQGYYFAKQWGVIVLPDSKADLAMEITASTTSPNVGDEIIFTARVHNAGPDRAESVKAFLDWPQGLTDIRCQANTAQQYVDGVWGIEKLDANATTELSCTAIASDLSQEQTVHAMVISRTVDDNLSNNEVSITLEARVKDKLSSIEGIVFHDANRNGTQDVSEESIQLVAVTLTGGDEQNRVWRTVYTDHLGTFKFEGLSAGTYTLEVAARGWMVDSAASAGDRSGIATPGKITNITLSSGEHAQGYIFAKVDSQNHDTAFLNASAGFDPRTPIVVGSDVGISFNVSNFGNTPIYGVSATIQWPESLTDIRCLDGQQKEVLGQWHIGDMTFDTTVNAELYCTAKVLSANQGDFIRFDTSARTANLNYGLSHAFLDIASSSSPENGVITGMVYNDLNGSGAFDSTDQVLEGVEVTLTGQDYLGNNVLRVANTDINGVFTFDSVERGNYSIKVADTPNLVNGMVSVGRSMGDISSGAVTNINFVPANVISQYHFSKRSVSDAQADLSLEALVFPGMFVETLTNDGELIVDESASYAIFFLENKGPDVALNAKMAFDWDAGAAQIACYPLTQDGGETLLIIGGGMAYFLGELIPQNVWDIGYLPGGVSPSSSEEISESQRLAICKINDSTGFSLLATVSSDTPDPELHNNAVVVEVPANE